MRRRTKRACTHRRGRRRPFFRGGAVPGAPTSLHNYIRRRRRRDPDRPKPRSLPAARATRRDGGASEHGEGEGRAGGVAEAGRIDRGAGVGAPFPFERECRAWARYPVRCHSFPSRPLVGSASVRPLVVAVTSPGLTFVSRILQKP